MSKSYLLLFIIVIAGCSTQKGTNLTPSQDCSSKNIQKFTLEFLEENYKCSNKGVVK